MEKSSLRNRKLEELNLHSKKSSAAKSAAIIKKFLSLEDFQAANDLFLYVSGGIEVSTRDIALESLKLGKNVYCPIIRDSEIRPGVFRNMKDMRRGKFGIMEPKELSRKCKFDAILIPGVAFDMRGFRIGRGGGHFDRFLAKVAGKKIALAFEFQILDKIEQENHDIPVDMIITEKRIIRIKKDKL